MNHFTAMGRQWILIATEANYLENNALIKTVKDQSVLLLSSFVHNSSINEYKNMKLRENTCYEMIY